MYLVQTLGRGMGLDQRARPDGDPCREASELLGGLAEPESGMVWTLGLAGLVDEWTGCLASSPPLRFGFPSRRGCRDDKGSASH